MSKSNDQSLQIRNAYVNGWNETMINIWRDRIMSLDVVDTGALYNSVSTLPVAHDDRFVDLIFHHQFTEYGLYQDFGVGREKPKGNSGEVGPTTQSGKPRKFRERRRWFSTKYYASVMNLKDFLAESIGHEFVGILSDALTGMNK